MLAAPAEDWEGVPVATGGGLSRLARPWHTRQPLVPLALGWADHGFPTQTGRAVTSRQEEVLGCHRQQASPRAP